MHSLVSEVADYVLSARAAPAGESEDSVCRVACCLTSNRALYRVSQFDHYGIEYLLSLPAQHAALYRVVRP